MTTLGSKAIGRVIQISVADDDIATVVALGYDRLTVERSANQGLTWVEITIPNDRPILTKEQREYTWADRAGQPNYLYRTRYMDTRRASLAPPPDDCGLSDPSDAIEGVGLATQCILTVEQLKQRYLFGVDFRNDDGVLLTDSTFQFYILAAIEYVEHELDLKILPQSFIENQDYDRNDQQAFGYIQLDNYPLISVEEFNVNYASGDLAISYPQEWLRIDEEHGQLRIVPSSGAVTPQMLGRGATFGASNLPHLYEIRYTAGFADCRVPTNILNIIGMAASLGPFNIFGDLIAGAGIANVSLSIDGLSQSVGTTSSATNAGYGSRIIQYGKQIKAEMGMLRRYYKGIRAHVA